MIQGGYKYISGVSGLVSIPVGAMVVQITARCSGGGTMSIDGGSYASVSPSFAEQPPVGTMIGPFDIDFNSCEAYFVSWVS